MHKLKHGIGQLKIARLPRHVLPRFLAVICVLKVITIIEFGKIKSKTTMKANELFYSTQKKYVENSNDLYDIVRDWFFDNGYLEPNYIDYSEHDLNEYIKHYTL